MAYALHSGTYGTFFPTTSHYDWVEPTLYAGIVGDLQNILPSSFSDTYSNTNAMNSRIATAPGGYWGDWMYTTRDTPVPITFELCHNGSVWEPGAFTVFENNSTQYIERLMPEFIYAYFAPVESHINALWDEIRGGFDYLLEMTPRLEISSASITGGVLHGDSVSLSLSMTCHGLRLGTLDDVNLIGAANLSFDLGMHWMLMRSLPLLHLFLCPLIE
ncbi:MAG: hypothetical protein ACW99U_10915 [Candidatus Thorarchaeota archaeon]|jgi:hypothetical protein